MKFVDEFKQFISRGNALDMAVGIIVGASFTNIVDGLVNYILMPPIGYLLGGIDFSSFKIVLRKANSTSQGAAIEYGLFINALINFIIIAFSIFILIKCLGAIYRKKEAPVLTKSCPECRMEIPKDAKKCGHCTSDL